MFFITLSENAGKNLNIPTSIIAIEGNPTYIHTIFVPLNLSNNHQTLLLLNMTNRFHFHFDPKYETESFYNTQIKYKIRTIEEEIKEELT